MFKAITDTIIDGLVIGLIVLALMGYSDAKWPWMPEHESKPWVENAYWEVK